MFQVNQYAIQNGKCFPITAEQARELNENGADIYCSYNNFSDWGKRKKEDLIEITGVYVEIDDGSKESQMRKIRNGPPPSCVIETKRGYQIHFYFITTLGCRADPHGMADWYHAFVKERLVPFYGADPQAADACRILRLPFYKYWKDGKGEFMINIAINTNHRYTIKQLERYFPKASEKKQEAKPVYYSDAKDGDFWSKANRIDCRRALEALSGTEHVSMEKFSFKKKSDGTTRIIIDGKPRNCWLDRNGLIGSVADGGPAVPNWLFYYHKDWKKVVEILKSVFSTEVT